MSFWNRLFGSARKASGDTGKDSRERDFDTLKHDGMAAMKQNKPDHAVRCFTRALELRDDRETRDHLADALLRSGDTLEAFRQLEYMAGMEPDNVSILLRMADIAYTVKAYNAMGEICEKANEIDSGNVTVNFYYARACFGKADYVNAMALLSKAINLSGGEPFWDAHLLKGRIAAKMGDIELAMAEADSILGALPDHEDALQLKAECTEVNGDHEGALQLYGKIIGLNPLYVEAYACRAEIRSFTGDKQGAEEDWDMVIKIKDGIYLPKEGGRQDKENRQETGEEAGTPGSLA